MRIGAVILVRDMARFIGACVRSLNWVNGIYLLDDNSSDGTAEVARREAMVPIIIERSNDPRTAFERGELQVRNFAIDSAIASLACNILISVDGDELVSSGLRTEIDRMWHEGYDTIALSMWHLFDEHRYLHFFEREFKGHSMIDPHVRVFLPHMRFEANPEFPEGTHPFIPSTQATLCLNGPFHFHMRYHQRSPYPNRTLTFFPPHVTEESAMPFLKPLPFTLPADIQESLELVDWADDY